MDRSRPVRTQCMELEKKIPILFQNHLGGGEILHVR